MKAANKILNREFDPPLRNKIKPLSMRLSGVININCAKSVTNLKLHNYTEPRLVKGKRWYIDFRYKVPPELQPEYGEWHRFRVNHRINRYKNDQYANEILDALKYSLEKGFNPFTDEQKEFGLNGESKEMTVKEAMNFFLEKQKGRGLEKDTLKRYTGVVRLILNWCSSKNLLNVSVNTLHKNHIDQLLIHHKTAKKWSNRQYNNVKNYLSTVFSFLQKSELVNKNPVSSIEKLKSTSTKYKYFDKKLFPKVNEIIRANDPYLFFAIQFIYYLSCRSGKELRFIKVGDILEGGDYFRFRSEVSKSDRDDLIPVDPNLKKVFKEMNLLNANPDHYIFSIKKAPGPKPVPIHYFSKRFAAIRNLCGLDNSWSLYSYRHTRAVHLLKDGAKLSDISKLFRHKDIAVTAIYTRSLGQDFDSTEVLKLSRKI